MKNTLLVAMLASLFSLASVNVYAKHEAGSEHESEAREMDADSNHDGKISFEEFKAAREQHMQEHFKRRDANGDGFIDESERMTAKDNWKKHHKGMSEKSNMHK